MAEVKVIEVQIKSNLDETNNDVSKLKTNLKTATNEAKDFDKAIGSKKGASFTELKDSIGGLVPGFDKASTGANSFNKQLLLLVANPIGAVVAAVVLAVVGLVAIFKTFQPVVDKVEQSVAALGAVLNVIKNTFIAVFTGTKSLGQAFSGLGSDMSSAAKRTMELVKAQQDLEDVLAQQEVQTSRTRAEINKLNVQAKNRALSEEERLKLLQRASALENQDFLQRRKNADEQVRQAREAIAIKAGFSKAEIKQLKEQGLAAKELAESKGGNFDEEFKILANAQKNRIGLEDESTANLEKNQNKQDALFDAQQAKRESQAAAAKARQEKIDADRIKNEEKAISDRKAYLEKANLVEEEFNLNAVGTEQQRKDANILAMQNDLSKKVEIQAQNTANEKEQSEIRIRIAEAEAQQKKDIQNAGFALADGAVNFLKQIAGKNKAIQKAAIIAENAIGIGKMIIANNAANIGALATPQAILTSGASAIPVIAMNNITTALGVATTIASTAKALSAVGGGSAGSAPSVGGRGGSSNTSMTPPAFNVVGASSTNQLAQTIGNQQNQPIKAYVVANDVTTQQGLDRNIVKSATIG